MKLNLSPVFARARFATRDTPRRVNFLSPGSSFGTRVRHSPEFSAEKSGETTTFLLRLDDDAGNEKQRKKKERERERASCAKETANYSVFNKNVDAISLGKKIFFSCERILHRSKVLLPAQLIARTTDDGSRIFVAKKLKCKVKINNIIVSEQ